MFLIRLRVRRAMTKGLLWKIDRRADSLGALVSTHSVQHLLSVSFCRTQQSRTQHEEMRENGGETDVNVWVSGFVGGCVTCACTTHSYHLPINYDLIRLLSIYNKFKLPLAERYVF